MVGVKVSNFPVIPRPFSKFRILKMFHSFLMKYPDLAPKSGQNDTQLEQNSSILESLIS